MYCPNDTPTLLFLGRVPNRVSTNYFNLKMLPSVLDIFNFSHPKGITFPLRQWVRFLYQLRLQDLETYDFCLVVAVDWSRGCLDDDGITGRDGAKGPETSLHWRSLWNRRRYGLYLGLAASILSVRFVVVCCKGGWLLPSAFSNIKVCLD